MGIKPVKNYEMSDALSRLQLIQQGKFGDDTGSHVGACECSSSMMQGPSPCCCGSGLTFFGEKN
jgi:hypothetical protein